MFLLAMNAKIPIASIAPIVIGNARFDDASSSSVHVTGLVDPRIQRQPLDILRSDMGQR